MPLFKYCKKEHNIKTSSGIFLGTLDLYKEIENHEIADTGEGQFFFNIKFERNTKIDLDIANLIFHGVARFGEGKRVFLPGYVNAKVKNIKINKITDEYVEIECAESEIHRTIQNSFIFCMSDQDEPKKVFDGYDDFWSIPDHKISQFASKISRLLIENLEINDIKLQPNSKIIKLRDINIRFEHGRVRYESRNLVFNDQIEYNRNRIIDTLTNIPFIKPEKFKNENEYRFVFYVSDHEKYIEPKLKSILLPNNIFSNIVA
ncbi:MAG: hypothetical protein O9308_03430 [Beijerinckiaceae bacterium]|nr:hypothetical protein [Beijerinckiaceae bacterium]